MKDLNLADVLQNFPVEKMCFIEGEAIVKAWHIVICGVSYRSHYYHFIDFNLNLLHIGELGEYKNQ